MNKILLIGFLIVFGGSAFSQQKVYQYSEEFFFPETTSLELRMMQSRVFKKSYKDIIGAIQASCQDSNGTFVPVYKYTACIRPSTLQTPFIISNNPDKGENKLYKTTQIKYEFPKLDATGNPIGAPFSAKGRQDKTPETVVRMRISFITQLGNETSNQVTNPAIYQANFKALADALFIEAIELSPAEMQ